MLNTPRGCSKNMDDLIWKGVSHFASSINSQSGKWNLGSKICALRSSLSPDHVHSMNNHQRGAISYWIKFSWADAIYLQSSNPCLPVPGKALLTRFTVIGWITFTILSLTPWI